MARISIEECWWTDPRRSKLIKLMIGDEERADGAAVRMWRLAQEFWKHGQGSVPLQIFETLEHAQFLLSAGLAIVGDDGFVYVRGSSQWLDWVREKREQAREAGLKSAAARREKSGTAQPKGGKGHKKTEREPNENRTQANGSEPSDSVSGSRRINTYTQKFEEIWHKYPGKGRINKPVAFKRYEAQIKTGPDERDLDLAVANYNRYLAKEAWRSPKQFDSFLGTERSGHFWQQFINPEPSMFAEPTAVVVAKDSFCGIGEP